VCLEEGALFDRATLSIAEQEGGNSLNKTLLVARYRALSRFRLQEYFDRQGASPLLPPAATRLGCSPAVRATSVGVHRALRKPNGVAPGHVGPVSSIA
jgi:hypothetical protein